MSLVYKLISVVSFAVGAIALILIVIGFAGTRQEYSAAIVEGICVLVGLPTAYITRKLGNRDD